MEDLDKIRVSDPALWEALHDVVHTTLENTLIQKPVYSLSETLSYKTVAELKSLAKLCDISGISKMKKAELVGALCEALPDRDNLEFLLHCLEWDEWEFFKKAAGHKQYSDNFVFADRFLAAQTVGLIQAFYDEKMIFVVPEEIRRTFSAIKKDGTVDEIGRSILLDSYARAAVHLYGIIPQDEFIELFNSQNEEKVTEDELFATLLRNINEDSEYCFWEDYLVHSDFEEEDFAGVPNLEEAIRKKPRYIPPKDEFLLYADSDYYEQTPQTEKLEAFVVGELARDRTEALDIVDEVVYACMAEQRIKDVMDVFDEHDIEFESKEQLTKLLPIVMDVWNNSRVWSNKGHTPAELSGNPQHPVLRVIPGGPKKPGRNDPCPCGSGKKYKKCCGRDE